ncbi:MAG: hypothetical protein HP007_03805 [Bacteroides sp.]|nr:hypothetical protein [Bacteroides sp.]
MNDVNEEMIDVEPICRQFKQYIEIDNRCILSAKFGDGKSHFLSKFTQMFSDEYLFITIYPVNYQVMGNGEIFELIKRDILLRLLSEITIKYNDIEFTKSFQATYYLNQNYEEVLGNLIQIIPQFNLCGLEIDLGNISKGLKSIISGYKEWEKKIKEIDKEKADKFIKDFDLQKGSIYEFDAISQLIYNIISDYKKSSGKKVVLIIEDLDRIDPAHIFRILNVFSAHFDNKSYGEGNKYNFDKIITVCDYNNINNIYHHVYGEKTDFIGYISKFSNIEPFNYSLYNLLKEYMINHLLDKSLLNYKIICNALCDNILASLKKEHNQFNLRIVKERLLKVSKCIVNENIPLKYSLEGYYVNSHNTFAILMAIIKVFCLEEKTIFIEDNIDEIINLIGTNWLILQQSDDDITFELVVHQAGSKIQINLARNLNNSYYDTDTIGYFDVLLCEDKIIKETNLYSYHNVVKKLMVNLFERKNLIIGYYKDNIIL